MGSTENCFKRRVDKGHWTRTLSFFMSAIVTPKKSHIQTMNPDKCSRTNIPYNTFKYFFAKLLYARV